MGNNNEKESFWSTAPGILTGIAAIITAITGLIIALNAAGIITINPSVPAPISTPVIPPQTPTPSPTPIVTQQTPTTSASTLPDLFVSEFSLDPSTPIQGSPVSVRIGVYNQGTANSGAFTVQWWAGENFTAPACTWRVDSLVARGGRILTCSYDGYNSWYARLTTKIVVDSAGEVTESDKNNNVYKMIIRVSKP